mmetsp:Transcript_68129/g.142318  ORF Transcript_68129/g.142318 Transcript_68129/m.142318 type:complete len:634 (+) Transcript_68129:148-2049(+)
MFSPSIKDFFFWWRQRNGPMTKRVSLWLSFCGLALAELVAGQVYAFGLFSDVLRSARGLGLSQAQIESVALSENLGQYVRFPAGFVYDRYGPNAALRMGFLMNGLGYLAMFAIVTIAEQDQPHGQEWWQSVLPCIFAATYGQGAGWIETGSISLAVKHFPEEAVGLLKTFFGLASALASIFFASLFAPNRAKLLVFFGLAPFLVGLPATYFCLDNKLLASTNPSAGGIQQKDLWTAAYGLAAVLAATLTLHSFLASSTSLLTPYEKHGPGNLLFLGMALGLLGVLATLPGQLDRGAFLLSSARKRFGSPQRECNHNGGADAVTDSGAVVVAVAKGNKEGAGGTSSNTTSVVNAHVLVVSGSNNNNSSAASPCARNSGSSGDASSSRRPSLTAVSDCSFSMMLRSGNFWKLLFALACGEGAGLMVLNNLGQIVKALDQGRSDLQPVCVSTFAVANALGRLCMGRLAVLSSLRRRQLLLGVLLTTVLAYLLFALAGEGWVNLVVAMPCLGFGYGCLWSLQPLLTAELFGKMEYGSKYATMSLAAVLGAIPLCRVVVPLTYDQFADEEGWCVGPNCFQNSLLAAAGQVLLGALLAYGIDDAGAYFHLPTDEAPGGDVEEGASMRPATFGKAHLPCE